MTKITANVAQRDFHKITQNVTEQHQIYHIYNGSSNGTVLMSEDEYDSLTETLYLLSQPGLKESIEEARKEIKKGEVNSFEEFFGEEL